MKDVGTLSSKLRRSGVKPTDIQKMFSNIFEYIFFYGLLYKVCGKWFYADEIIGVRNEVSETPDYFYNAIHKAQDEMCENIYRIAKKFGRRSERKDGGITYTLSIKSKSIPCYISNPRAEGKTVIDKIVVLDSPTYVHGYTTFIDKDGSSYASTELTREMFNIYSSVYRKVYHK